MALRASRAGLLAAALALLGSSCGLLKSMTHSKPSHAADIPRLEFELRNIADDEILDTGRAMRRLSKEVGTPEAHLQTLSWSVNQTNRVLAIASNPYPLPAFADFLMFVSVQRMLHEEYWLPTVYGEADRPVLEAYRRAEENCWKILRDVLNQKQQEGLRGLIAKWREENPDLHLASTLEAPSFADFIAPEKSGGKVPIVSDLFQLLSIDPLADLEPAVREVATTRETGERIFFYAQHLPQLLSQEVELSSLRTAKLPEVQSALKDAERFSLAAESFAATAAALPKSLRTEAEGAIHQLSDELGVQGQSLVSNIEKAQAPVQSILTQSRETLDAGTQTSKSIQELIASLDKFVSKPSAVAGDGGGEPGPPKHPFDVREYGDSAQRIGDAAHELTTAVATIDQDLPRLEKALDEAAGRAEKTVDHAFGRALLLVLATIAGIAIAVLAVRVLSPKESRRQSSA